MTEYAEVQKLTISSRPNQRGPQRGGPGGVLDQSAKPLKQSLAQGESQHLSAPAVEFRNVVFSFEDEKVLDGFSFTVMRGEIKIILSAKNAGGVFSGSGQYV